MADKKREGPGEGGGRSAPRPGETPYVAGDPLNARDHKILENAIRGPVSRLVGGNQGRLSSGSNDRRTPSDIDLRLHPELDPLARQLPGTERAMAFREMFMQSLVDPDPRSNREMIKELQAAGIPMQTLAIHLFSPVAARLGNLWCADEADFMQVAVASTRLGMIINHLSHSTQKAVAERADQRRVLLARTRGAMHTIGVSIVATCFRDMGWAVDGGIDLEVDDDLYMRLSSTRYHLLGISVGQVDEVKACSEAIARVHANPVTKGMKIAVGGPAVLMYPDAFHNIGADIVAQSALEVMQLSYRLTG